MKVGLCPVLTMYSAHIQANVQPSIKEKSLRQKNGLCPENAILIVILAEPFSTSRIEVFFSLEGVVHR
jgi:hypothetical protein